ncbi:lysozyme inhibitor LprI family protein [Azospirillum doebereinerae]|uniref:lysozyme inhibitor LprI family protein n=1 Tax=Azospirillum doebereinerae TaxID=92933 RepID=UPI001EE57E30|nr:hypothetical protein [Azospirillum doebereinerae]MCG5242627.1 hypothetical protein [Azospirillum doebereinerae]
MTTARSRFWLLTGAALLALAGAHVTPAAAQSLSCAKPASPVDRTLCGSADLKVANEDVATLLRDTLANSPAAERDTVQRAQQAFLAERDRACADRSALESCRRLYEKRVTDLQTQNSAAQKKLAAVAAGIPKDPKAAAAALQRYDGAAAKAWLVYLYHSGQAPVADKEATIRALVTTVTDRDLPPDPELREEMRNLGDVATAPLGTALLFLRHVLSTTEMEAPCFLFTKHGQPAFEAFGAFWGNSRDSSPALCEPLFSVFDSPEWSRVEARIAPAIDPALEERGSIRQGYERQFEVDNLQASLVPSTLLEAPHSPEARKIADKRKAIIAAFRSWTDFDAWPEAEYKATIAALPAALAATARVYRDKFGLNPQTADQAARAAADRFIATRLALLLPDD